MNLSALEFVVGEMRKVLPQTKIGKIFQIGAHSLAFDFRPHPGAYLLISAEPSRFPRIHFIERRLRDLEKSADSPSIFLLFLRKRLSDAVLRDVSVDEGERVVRFEFYGYDEETDKFQKIFLIAQLTGRSANVFILNENREILHSLRESDNEHQRNGDVYAPPARAEHFAREDEINLDISLFANRAFPFSSALDKYFQQLAAKKDFDQTAQKANAALRQEIARREKLLGKLRFDLNKHGNADEQKKIGDLILANLSTARRDGTKIVLTDYFDENLREITLEADENVTLKELAEKYFARYGKARRADAELSTRIAAAQSAIVRLRTLQNELAPILIAQNADELEKFIETNSEAFAFKKSEERARIEKSARKAGKKIESKISGARRYRSADGYEILVGRTSNDNDHLTMHVAKSLDWWLHAADYSGSHVIVRNKSKGELPPKTLRQAAELAAKFSHAKNAGKVAVNYTQRKFVNKPKGAKAGLVRLASFKTMLVEPNESAERILD